MSGTLNNAEEGLLAAQVGRIFIQKRCFELGLQVSIGKKSVAGLDIGSSSIKMVELEGKLMSGQGVSTDEVPTDVLLHGDTFTVLAWNSM